MAKGPRHDWRALAGAAGLGLVTATTHAAVIAAGGYGTPNAWLQIAVSVGLVAGAVALGSAASHKRIALAFAIAVGLLAGEAYALIATAERVTIAREATQAPLKDAIARRSATIEALKVAEDAKPVSTRLTAATRQLELANEAARTEASKTGCKVNCRDLLQAAVDSAQREVTASRTEVAEQSRILAERVTSARAALAQAPVPPSATPLADRIGMSPWLLDLVAAGLLSLCGNGLAAALLAFAAHGPKGSKSIGMDAMLQTEVDPAQIDNSRISRLRRDVPSLDAPRFALPRSKPPRIDPPGTSGLILDVPRLVRPRLVSATGDVDRLMLDCVTRAKGAKVSWADLFLRYRKWCDENAFVALTPEGFGQRLDEFRVEGIVRARKHGDDVFCIDVKLAS